MRYLTKEIYSWLYFRRILSKWCFHGNISRFMRPNFLVFTNLGKDLPTAAVTGINTTFALYFLSSVKSNAVTYFVGHSAMQYVMILCQNTFIVSPKNRDTMDHAGTLSVCRDFMWSTTYRLYFFSQLVKFGRCCLIAPESKLHPR